MTSRQAAFNSKKFYYCVQIFKWSHKSKQYLILIFS